MKKSKYIIYVYEVVSNETGEVFKVLSRRFIDSFKHIYNYGYVELVGSFDNGIYREWD